MTTQSSVSVLINGFGVLFVILNSFGLGLRLPVGKLLGHALRPSEDRCVGVGDQLRRSRSCSSAIC
jgi:hypothetical protein